MPKRGQDLVSGLKKERAKEREELAKERAKVREELAKAREEIKKLKKQYENNASTASRKSESVCNLLVCDRAPSSAYNDISCCEKFLRPMLAVLSPIGMWAVWRYSELKKVPTSNDPCYLEAADSIRRIFKLHGSEQIYTLITTVLDRLYLCLDKKFRVSTQYPLSVGHVKPCFPDYYFYRLEKHGSSCRTVPFGVGVGKLGRGALDGAARQGAFSIGRCFRGGIMMGLYHDSAVMKIDLHANLHEDENKNCSRIHSGEVARIEVASGGLGDLVAFLRVHVELLELLSSPENQGVCKVKSPQLLTPWLLESKHDWLRQFFPLGKRKKIIHYGSRSRPMIRVYCANERLHKLFAVRDVPSDEMLPRPVYETLEKNMDRLTKTMNDVHDNALEATYFMIDDETAMLSVRYMEPERSNPSARHFYSVYETLMKLQEYNMVHGDVRKENILFAEDKGYLIDFDMMGVAGKTTYPSNYNCLGEEHRQVQGQRMKTQDDVMGLAFAMRQFTPTDENKAKQWTTIWKNLDDSGTWPDADQDVAFELREINVSAGSS